jgi:phospholipase C
MSNSALWARTVFFLTFDENGGFFDHVPTTTAPAGMPGEHVTAPPVPDSTVIGDPPISGPIGLGSACPCSHFAIQPRRIRDLRPVRSHFGAAFSGDALWSRSSRPERMGRSAVGDMTTAFHFARPDTSIPNLPSSLQAIGQVIQECQAALGGMMPYSVPNPQMLPTQESGTATRPSGTC